MLLLFASAWPFNIVRAWRARTSVGNSVVFMVVIEIAYLCGMLSKIVADNVNYVFAFYVLDFCLVGIALCIWFRNRAIDRSRGRIPDGARRLRLSIDRGTLRFI